MNRRSFLSGLSSLVGGILLEKAIPLGRVWSFPKEVKCLNTGFHWDNIQVDDLSDDLLYGHRAYLIGYLKDIQVFSRRGIGLPGEVGNYKVVHFDISSNCVSHLDTC